MNAVDAKVLFKTVASLGLKPAQVRRLLPSWWSREVESSPDGVAELAMLLGRRLSIDVDALLAGRLAPRGAVTSVAFKHRADTSSDSLDAASHIAASLAQTIVSATTSNYRELAPNSTEIQTIARQLGNGVLNFHGLLAACWSSGIPVIPLPNLPVGVRKMDGAALHIGKRPAIVIARRKSSRAWLSFILAHELAHIVLRHVRAGSTIVDVSLQDMATYATESAADTQEREADTFALELLGGDEVRAAINKWSEQLSAVELAAHSRKAANNLRIEAGHLVLRYGFETKRWGEAMIALRFLHEDLDPQAELLDQLQRHVDMDLVADDLQDMVQQITGWDRPHTARE